MSDVGSVQEWHEIAKAQERGDDGCTPRFYMNAVPDKRRSQVEGRACFKERPYVQIFVPGEKNLCPDRPVQDEDKERWPDAWGRFERTQEETVSGTPVEQWPFLDRVRVAEMKANKFHTVEAIAACPDSQLKMLGHEARDLRERARQHLAPQDETETELRQGMSDMQAAMAELRAEMLNLQNANKHLETELEEEKAKPKRRGRPPRVHVDEEADAA